MSFERGDVVQRNGLKRIGVVLGEDTIGKLFGTTEFAVKWCLEHGEVIDFEGTTPIESLTKIDGYEMEAALALGDTDRALQLYNDMKRQRDQAISATVPELHRRYTFNLKLGADSTRDIDSALNSIQYDLAVLTERQELNRSYHSISGGPSAGWTVDIQFDPEMTHDRYFEQLDAYLEQKRGN